jgi:hypothetical protein
MFPYQIPRQFIDKMPSFEKRKEIVKEFQEIINRYSLENDSNTPDFILAEYLWDCLISANILICARIAWYNPEGRPVTKPVEKNDD